MLLSIYSETVHGEGVGGWIAPHLGGNFEVGIEQLSGRDLQEARAEACRDEYDELYDARRGGGWLPQFLAPHAYRHGSE